MAPKSEGLSSSYGQAAAIFQGSNWSFRVRQAVEACSSPISAKLWSTSKPDSLEITSWQVWQVRPYTPDLWVSHTPRQATYLKRATRQSTSLSPAVCLRPSLKVILFPSLLASLPYQFPEGIACDSLQRVTRSRVPQDHCAGIVGPCPDLKIAGFAFDRNREY